VVAAPYKKELFNLLLGLAAGSSQSLLNRYNYGTRMLL